MLATTRTVIVDEIHAVAGNKRGVHLAISLERLEALAGGRSRASGSPRRRSRSKKWRAFWSARSDRARRERCRSSTAATSASAISRSKCRRAARSGDVGRSVDEVYDRLAELVREHRTTLVFVNTRRTRRTRGAAALRADRRGARHCPSRQPREGAAPRCGAAPEARRAEGARRDRVARARHRHRRRGPRVPARSPRSINAFLQRVGRAGHAVGGTPKGRLFPLSRDDLVECAALLDAVRRGELDGSRAARIRWTCWRSRSRPKCRAANGTRTSCSRWSRARMALRNLERAEFDEVVQMLAEGFSTRRGRTRRAHSPRRGESHAARSSRARGSRRSHPAARFPTPRITKCCWSRPGTSSARCTKISPSRARGRRVPARQYFVSDSARRARHDARAGCAGPAAVDSLLARRSAGTHG